MTQEDVWELKPGRDFDEVINDKIFGDDVTIVCGQPIRVGGKKTADDLCDQILGKYRFYGRCPKCERSRNIYIQLPNYSTNIFAANLVMKKMHEYNLYEKLWYEPYGCYQKYCCVFARGDGEGRNDYSTGDTVSQTICEAALIASIKFMFVPNKIE